MSPNVAHPRKVLFPAPQEPPPLAPCDHYAGSEKFILRSFELLRTMGPLFDVTCDLEDGATAGNELSHAALVADLLSSPHRPAGNIGVRIHAAENPVWRQELLLLLQRVGPTLSHITIPKTTSADGLISQLETLHNFELHAGIKTPIPVHVLIETPGALRDVDRIAQLAEVRTLEFGIMDFVSSFHGALSSAAMVSPGQFEYPLIREAKTQLVSAALRYGKVPVHNVSVAYADAEGTRADALRAKSEFGFLRMWSVHPHQIPVIINAFAATDEELAFAQKVLVAGHKAQWGPVSLNQKLFDRASYRYYWTVVEKAQALGKPLMAEVQKTFF